MDRTCWIFHGQMECLRLAFLISHFFLSFLFFFFFNHEYSESFQRFVQNPETEFRVAFSVILGFPRCFPAAQVEQNPVVFSWGLAVPHNTGLKAKKTGGMFCALFFSKCQLSFIIFLLLMALWCLQVVHYIFCSKFLCYLQESQCDSSTWL